MTTGDLHAPALQRRHETNRASYLMSGIDGPYTIGLDSVSNGAVQCQADGLDAWLEVTTSETHVPIALLCVGETVASWSLEGAVNDSRFEGRGSTSNGLARRAHRRVTQ